MVSRDNPDFLSAKTIMGDKVVNSAGDDLGKIEDLMIDLHNGRVGYAVLSFGGLAGMGDKLFAIPWQALSLRLHEHAFTLDIPRDVLEKAEGFDKDNWPVTREELSRTYSYYGYQPYWQTGVTGQTTPAGTSREARGMIESQGPAGPGSRENPDFLSADSIKSDKLVNRAGDNIGKIEELMIDLQDGRVAYAVISHGGFLGIGNKLFAIPWQSFSLRVHEHTFVLDIPKETLDKAKGIDKDNWPLTRDELSSTFSYYGYQPYWTTGAATAGALTGAAAAARTSTGMAGETESERMARMERERQGARPGETEAERMARMERERQGARPGETEAERMARMERERQGARPGGTEAERMARAEREAHVELPGRPKSEKVIRTETTVTETVVPAETEPGMVREGAEPGIVREEAETERTAREERERLEALRRSEEERVSQLERERMEKERQAEELRQRLSQLERERMEAQRQAEAERQRLMDLERELQDSRRQEETEKVARLEREMMAVRKREEDQRARMAQLERDRTEIERQAEVERQRLAELESARMEKERLTETEKEKLTGLERERMEAERLTEDERQRLAELERERAEAESRRESERMARMGGMEGRVGPELLPESRIRGYRVVDKNGDDVGRIEDLIVDLDSGRIAYAALSFGGFLGMSDKLFAVPWQALSPRPDEQAFTLDVPRDVLEKAEGFDRDRYPTSREELSRTYTYYGYQPYWQTGMEGHGMPRRTESERMTRAEGERQGRLQTAEEVMAGQEVETIENLEKKETDKEKLARLEREKEIAERREHKYGK